MSLFGDIAGLAAINTAYNQLGGVGETALSEGRALAQELANQSRFKGFGVTGAYRGSINADPLGNISMQEGATEAYLRGLLETGAKQRLNTNIDPVLNQAIQLGGQEALSRGLSTLRTTPAGLSDIYASAGSRLDAGDTMLTRAMQGTAGREQDVYDRIRATQMAEEGRQQLALEERLANQGRLGVRTAMFGGTPEQFAFEKARSEAQNQAALMAIQQAQQEQAQQAALSGQFTQAGSSLYGQGEALQTARAGRGMALQQGGAGLLSSADAREQLKQQMGLADFQASYLPLNQKLQMLQAGMGASQLAQRGQLYGTGLFGEARSAGLEAFLGAGLGQANLIGNVGAGVLAAGASSSDSGLFDFIKDIFT
jgi:hypothetical protein